MGFRQDFVDTIHFKKAEKIPAMEFMAFWPEAEELYQEHTGETPNCQHFGLKNQVALPIDFNFVPAFQEEIIEETDEYVIMRDATNTLKKSFKHSSAMPHYLSFPIKTRQDFYDLKPRLNPLSPERYPENFGELVKKIEAMDVPIHLVCRGPFAFLRDFINFEDLMIMFIDDPDFIDEMVSFHTDFLIQLWDKAFDFIIPDFILIGEDMAYKNGPMISPAMVRKHIYPSWKRLNDHFKQKGVPLTIIDSDGDIRPILPIIREAGFGGILPLERPAGMDPEQIRQEYPDLVMIGGVDKLKLAAGKEAIDEELEMIKRLYPKGGYIPSADHSVPPIVSYDNYKYYIEKLKQIK